MLYLFAFQIVALALVACSVAMPSKPKPKSSMSFQMVDFGLPNNGISKYSTKIINEKKAILTDRRKTPDPSPSKGYHKREASRPWPKPKSSRSFQVYF